MCQLKNAPLLLLSFLLFSQSAVAQKWQRLAPDLFDVQLVSKNVVVACGAYGVVLRSDDAGESWELQSTDVYQSLYDIHFFDERRGVVVGESGTAFTTGNGGLTWNRSTFPLASSVLSLVFREDGYGIASTLDSHLVETSDRGETWSLMETELQECLADLAFAGDGSLCAVNNDRGRIYRSVDMGQTWSIVYADSTYAFHEIEFVDNLGVVVGGGGRPEEQAEDRPLVLRSTDNGRTWNRQPLSGVDFRLTSMGMDGSGRFIVASGMRSATSQEPPSNRAVVSSDGGNTWESYEMNSLPGLISIYGVAVEEGGRAVVAGSMQSVFLTEDGGQQWDVKSHGRVHDFFDGPFYRKQIIGSRFMNDGTLLAFGRGGLVSSGIYLRSANKGATWKSNETIDGIADAAFFEDGTGIALPWISRPDSRQKVYRIEDYGVNWIREATDLNGDYDYGLAQGPVKFESGLFFSTDSLIFRSTDHGESWRKVAEIPGVIYTANLNVLPDNWILRTTDPAVFLDDTTVTQTYRIMQSRDQGQTWETVMSTTDFLSSASSITFMDANTGFYGTVSGKLFRTIDGGGCWELVGDFDGSVNCMAAFTDSLFYGAGRNGLVVHSTDAGETWEAEHVFPLNERTPAFTSISLSGDGRTMLITGEGVIMRGDFPEPVTSVEERRKSYGQNISLTVRPNPVSGDKLQIYLSGVAGPSTDIELYDVSGRLLKRQTIATMDPEGTWVSLDAGDLVSGAYRIVAGRGEQRTSTAVTIVR